MSPYRTLPLDRTTERSVAALRLVAAVVVAGAAIWLALLRPSGAAWICIGGAFVASLAWLGMAAAARRRVQRAEDHRLVIGEDGLTLVEGARVRRSAWEEIEAIEVDEDRLVVVVRLRGEEEPIVVEPRYGGLGVFDLDRAIRAAREQAARPPAG